MQRSMAAGRGKRSIGGPLCTKTFHVTYSSIRVLSGHIPQSVTSWNKAVTAMMHSQLDVHGFSIFQPC